MAEAELLSAIIDDFEKLLSKGSGDQVLDKCLAFREVQPVATAVNAGALLSIALRTLLQDAAVAAAEGERDIRAGAALTGIVPANTGRGARANPAGRRVEAGKVYGGARAMADPEKCRRCLRAFAEAVLRRSYALADDSDAMASYLRRCGAAKNVVSEADRGNAPTDRFTRLIPLTRRVSQALDAARDTCKARLRAFYTPDLLLALLDMPQSPIPECLNAAKGGLASQLRKYLVEAVGSLTAQNCKPFEPFEWSEREDVQLAQDLVVRFGGNPFVTELHLLLGVLSGGSTTRNDLLEELGQKRFDHLREVVEAKLRQPPPIRRTRDGRPRR